MSQQYVVQSVTKTGKDSLFGSLSLPASHQKVTILYFNDAHEIAPVEGRGGVARLKAIVDQIRAENPNTLVIFGGDLAGGTLFGKVFQGMPIVDALNRIGITFGNFGQHDFDWGSNHTKLLVKASRFKWISSNLTGNNNQPFAGVSPVYIRNIGGVKVGFLGLTSAMETTTADKGVVQRDLYSSAKRAVNMLQKNGAQAIIAITQLFPEEEDRLMKEVPQIDVLLGEEQEGQFQIRSFGGRPIITPCGNIGCLVRIDINKSPGSSKPALEVREPIYLDDHVDKNPMLGNLEERYMGKLERKLAEHIGKLIGEDLPHEESRTRETALGNLVADAFRWLHRSQIAVMQGGGLRTSLRAGTIAVKDAYSILPFGNTVQLVNVSGKEFRNLLEHSLTAEPNGRGRLVQVSGVRFEFDPNKPAGQRLTEVWVGERKLNDTMRYTLSLPSYILRGGDGFPRMPTARRINTVKSARTDADVLIDYIRNKGTIQPRVEGRIRESKQ